MKNLTFWIILLFSLSCNKEVAKEVEVNDLLYVSTSHSKMPVYLHGNLDNNTIIVVLHGGPGGNGLEYRTGQYARDLEKEFVMAYWDQRGQGMAQGHGGTINIDLMVDDLVKVIQVIKHKYGEDKSIFLYGHSWGGLLGSAFMIDPENQKLVKGWIESNGAHDLPVLNKETVKLFMVVAKEQIDANHSVKEWQEVLDWTNKIDTNAITPEISIELNERAFKVEEYLTKDGVLFSSNQSDDDVNYTQPIDKLKNLLSGNKTNLLLNDEIEKTSLTAQLKNIRQPCLFLFSKYDFVVPSKLGFDAFREVSTTEKSIIIFDHSGHSPMDNEASIYAPAIIAFVNKYK